MWQNAIWTQYSQGDFLWIGIIETQETPLTTSSLVVWQPTSCSLFLCCGNPGLTLNALLTHPPAAATSRQYATALVVYSESVVSVAVCTTMTFKKFAQGWEDGLHKCYIRVIFSIMAEHFGIALTQLSLSTGNGLERSDPLTRVDRLEISTTP